MQSHPLLLFLECLFFVCVAPSSFKVTEHMCVQYFLVEITLKTEQQMLAYLF